MLTINTAPLGARERSVRSALRVDRKVLFSEARDTSSNFVQLANADESSTPMSWTTAGPPASC